MSGNIVSSPSLSSNCLMKCSGIHIRSDIRTEYIPGHGGDGVVNTSCARLCFGEAQQQYVIIMACVWGFTGVYCIIRSKDTRNPNVMYGQMTLGHPVSLAYLGFEFMICHCDPVQLLLVTCAYAALQCGSDSARYLAEPRWGNILIRIAIYNIGFSGVWGLQVPLHHPSASYIPG